MTKAAAYPHFELVGMDGVDSVLTAQGEAVAAHFFRTVGVDAREAWDAYQQHAECLNGIGERATTCPRLAHAFAILFHSAQGQAIEHCLNPGSRVTSPITQPIGAKLRLVLRSHPQTFPPGFTVMGCVGDDHGFAHTTQ